MIAEDDEIFPLFNCKAPPSEEQQISSNLVIYQKKTALFASKEMHSYSIIK
jgi:hypothetical protein